jgi:coenzyme F420-reducing hydrogenase gamma subunit
LTSSPKPRIAVVKLASCDGCQLAFLNLGEKLLELSNLVEFVHFAEAGPVGDMSDLAITFIEGSITTREDREMVRKVRRESRFLVTIGACATSGGIQALRNFSRGGWLASVYPSPEYVDFLDRSTPVASEIPVDLELWGCPVNGQQILEAIRSLLFGARPVVEKDKVCLECKRRETVCVMVARGIPCLGPVTLTGCGAICPSFGRGCYGCYGPSENPETPALGRRFAGLGLLPPEIARRFLFINGNAEPFREEGLHWIRGGDHG